MKNAITLIAAGLVIATLVTLVVLEVKEVATDMSITINQLQK